MNMQDLKSRSEDVADLLTALANSHRLLILCELNNKELSVSELEAMMPLSQSALSQHLAKLREHNVVTTRREAQNIYYSLADGRVRRLMATLYTEFCGPPKRSSKK